MPKKIDFGKSLKGINWVGVGIAVVLAAGSAIVNSVTGQQKDNKLNTLWDEYEKNQNK